MGNPRRPQPNEMGHSLRRFIERCWTQHLRWPGRPKITRYGNLIWLALMPYGEFVVDSAPSGSTLHRFRPVMCIMESQFILFAIQY
jgi:hypothetical protein